MSVLYRQLPDSLDTGLVAKYDLDGDATDSSGNGNDGTVVGATSEYNRFGDVGSALRFDGLDDSVNLGVDLLSGSLLTLACFVKVTNYTTPIHILTRVDSPTTQVGQIRYSLTTSGEPQAVFVHSSGNYVIWTATGCSVPVGMWTHVAFVTDLAGDITYCVVNGRYCEMSKSTVGSSRLEEFTSNVVEYKIAKMITLSYTDYSAFVCDALYLYNRKLSQFEIECLYREFIPKP